MCWVSAVGPQAVTVSGPPTTLEQFIQYLSRQATQQVVKQLPIFGPYHAPYLRLGSDFAQFLSECNVSSNLLAGLPVLRNVISASTGNSVQADNALDLLGDAVQSIIHEPVCLDLVIEEFAFFCNLADNPCSPTITAVCPTTGLGGIEGALRSQTQAAISIDNFHDLVREWNPSPGSLDAPLAIVGTGCRFPGADTPEELWELLESGQDMHKTIPQSRFDINKHVDPTLKRKNTSSTPYGCFIDQPGQFDLRLFNMSPSEAAQTDPMQRLALMTAYEALEMSGFVPNRTPSTALDRVGTFYGQTSDDYRDTNAAQEIGTYFITGGLRAFGPGRINYYFNLGGPSYNIDTACSSSLTAIHLACASIRSGHCDTAVAGGLSVLTSPDLYAGLSRGHFLSETGSCKTFDHGADGYCRADGIGTVIIKRLADAQRDNDNILGVVLGTGTNHSAEAVSLTHPHPQTQAKLFRDVIERSGIDPLDVNYVEMHGTGTQAGDSAEVASVVDVVAPFGQRKLDNPLYVGSIKVGT
ncbi:polyketide synthase [Aspergillus melleus]|uniref:polyketide synthase n=1 Tax=Aspergillus melleus TaxID=138277 RepID=UPI001E8D46A8|nr:polyketide synthase [Aspergillus melleus]KAH8423425.1 polyketide synthase [Aspergillus melleus]